MKLNNIIDDTLLPLFEGKQIKHTIRSHGVEQLVVGTLNDIRITIEYLDGVRKIIKIESVSKSHCYYFFVLDRYLKVWEWFSGTNDMKPSQQVIDMVNIIIAPDKLSEIK